MGNRAFSFMSSQECNFVMRITWSNRTKKRLCHFLLPYSAGRYICAHVQNEQVHYKGMRFIAKCIYSSSRISKAINWDFPWPLLDIITIRIQVHFPHVSIRMSLNGLSFTRRHSCCRNLEWIMGRCMGWGTIQCECLVSSLECLPLNKGILQHLS